LAALVFVCVVLAGIHLYVYAVPGQRLGPDATYAEMEADHRHRYIDLRLDHDDPALGTFRGFYLLSANFQPSENVTFVLTDGQMELVGTHTDFHLFDSLFGDVSYVLVGVRGQSPTFLPEVHPGGAIDYERAMKLYGSNQQVEDIETVRRDMQRTGLLSASGRINVFGASGAGVLAQQYVSKYASHVNRVLLESTGAPDLALNAGLPYSPRFRDFNAPADRLLTDYLTRHPSRRAALANVLYQQGRSEPAPKAKQLLTLQDLGDGGFLAKYQFQPMRNLRLLEYMIKAPKSLMARVCWFELVGADLERYDPRTGTNLLYDISQVAVSDVLDWHRRNHVAPMRFVIDRRFAGEVLILKGRDDVVFGDEINQRLRDAYPNARLLFFDDGHRLQRDPVAYRAIRKEFLEGGFQAVPTLRPSLVAGPI
jgi:pimeloyl-ACP methyl ester carboxylesterase